MRAIATFLIATAVVSGLVVPGVQSAPYRQEAAQKPTLAQQALEFESFVFTGENLPKARFANPAVVESIIGAYTLDVKYYDSAMNLVTKADKPGRYGAVVTIKAQDGKTTETRYFTLFRQVEGYQWWRNDGRFSATLPKGLGIDPKVAENQSGAISGYMNNVFHQALRTSPDGASLLAGLYETKASDPPVGRLSPDSLNDKWWYALRQKLGDAPKYQYLTGMPKDYDTDKSKKWPLMLFLHGSGERGSDVERVRVHGPLKEEAKGTDLPFVVIAPQCPANGWWSPVQLSALLDEVQAKYRIDPDRVYVTGLSMGGFGTWALALEYPNRFAAIAPICGGSDPKDAARIANLPIWNFHGGKDGTVPITASEDMIKALKAAGAKEVEFTVYPDAGHDSWTETYKNPKLYEWLLAHKRK